MFSFFSSLFLSVISIPYALFGLLGYQYHLSGDNSSEKKIHGFFSMLTSFMKYKVSFVMILISLAILNNSSMYLSNVYVAGSVVAIIILAFMGIYNSDVDLGDTTQMSRIIKKFK